MAENKKHQKTRNSSSRQAHTKRQGLLQAIHPLIQKLASCEPHAHSQESRDHLALNHALAFINEAPVMTAFIDLDYHFLATSKSWDKWFAHWLMPKTSKVESLIGHKINQFSSTFPLTLLKSLELSLKGKSVCCDFLEIETVYRQKRWIKLETFPWKGIKNTIQGIVIFCNDVTDQKKLFFDNQNLHHTNEMLQNFSLIFSHDLIQPLRQIYNHTYLIEEYLKEILGPHHPNQNILDPIKNCVNRAKELCEGIVFYCRHGDLTINPEAVSLSEILTNISEQVFSNTNIIFRNMADPDLKLLANKTSLMQLFQNLLDNAIKHGNLEFPIITLSARRLKNGFYKFDLHNNSYCPKSIKRKKIFDAFESSKCNGSGLGLMICKKIVTAYGGHIVLKSSPLKGTTVTFTLPSCDQHEKGDEQYPPNTIACDESDHKTLEIGKICE